MNNGVLKFFTYIILLIYTMVTISNLYMIYKKKNNQRNIFNIFLMPLLSLFYFLSFRNQSILIYISIFLFWIGDIIFTKKRKKNIILGFNLFFIGIIFYIIKIASFIKLGNLNYLMTILLIFIYFGLIFFAIAISYEYAIKYFKKDIIFLYILAFLNSILCIFIILAAISQYQNKIWYLILGSNLFFISNLLFSFVILVKNNRFFNICVTLTYSISNLLLIIGFGYLLI